LRGQLPGQTAEAKGERILAEESQGLGWSESDLVLRPETDAGQMAMAVRLGRETSLSIKGRAARVHWGTSHTANARFHNAMKERVPLGPDQRSFGI
jgi:hypothetical protein